MHSTLPCERRGWRSVRVVYSDPYRLELSAVVQRREPAGGDGARAKLRAERGARHGRVRVGVVAEVGDGDDALFESGARRSAQKRSRSGIGPYSFP